MLNSVGNKRILVTGAAGFIGSHLVEALVTAGGTVVGIDHLDASYGAALPRVRLENLEKMRGDLVFIRGDLLEQDTQQAILSQGPYDAVFHLAAWPGVRGGEMNPAMYLRNNIEALAATLRFTHEAGVDRFVFASSSSVYGNQGMQGPCHESDASAGKQLSFYASTKWLGEGIIKEFVARTDIRAVSARFFTVIGPNGRPDMAYAKFAKAALEGKPLTIYGDGNALRDYTSIVDTIWALQKLSEIDLGDHVAQGDHAPLNIGFSQSRTVLDLVHAVAAAIDEYHYEPEFVARPSVDAQATLANADFLAELCGPRLPESLEEMVRRALSDRAWIFL